MLGYQRTLDRQESTCAYMEADGFRVDSPGLDPSQDVFREVQAGRRRRDGTADMGIERLIAFDVDLFGLPVQIRWNRHGSADLQDPGKGRAIRPAELHDPSLAVPAQQPGFQAHIRSFGRPEQGQDIVFPFLGIADHALPGAGIRRRKGCRVFHRPHRLQAEDLDMGTGRPLEMHAGRNDLRIVEDYEGILWKQIRQLAENVLVNLSALIMEQLGRVPLGKRIFGNPLIGKRIIVILDMDFRYHFTVANLPRSYTILHEF